MRAVLTDMLEAKQVRSHVAVPLLERAVALSREKYCSVWHSMRHDIEFTTAVELQPMA